MVTYPHSKTIQVLSLLVQIAQLDGILKCLLELILLPSAQLKAKNQNLDLAPWKLP